MTSKVGSYFFLLLLLGIIFSLPGCKVLDGSRKMINNTDTFYLDIKARAAFKLINSNLNSNDLIIIDVRRPDERVEGYLDNSLEINFKDENFSMQLQQLDKTKTYLVYCQGGYRSKKAMTLMKEIGFKRVYNLKGGYLVWKSKKLPIKK